MDQVIGVVRARDVLLAIEEASKQTDNSQIDQRERHTVDTADLLRRIAYPPLFVPLTTSPVKVVELFRSNHAHVAFAIDEYGGVEGIVTPFDVLEALVGKFKGAEQQ